MNLEPERAAERAPAEGSLLALAILSFMAGAAVGLVAAAFRLALVGAERLRDSILIWAHGGRIFGFLAIVGVSAVATGLAAWLVRMFSPQATGSGIPHVEAELNGNWSGSPLRIIPVKFVGGLLAIGSGLALGREGPSVQMGASLAHLVGRIFRCSEEECKALGGWRRRWACHGV
jgi:CIC family chloride channel protein